jgi:hypothetical protein
MNRTTKTMIRATLASALLFAAGCNKAKSEAQQGAKDVEAACKEDRDEGLKLGREWYGKNDVFKEAVDAASQTWKVSDADKFNYCGVMFVEVKSRIDNG